jgi:hypothetical protein
LQHSEAYSPPSPLAYPSKFTLTALISLSSNSSVGFCPCFFSQDYRLSSDNALAAGKNGGKGSMCVVALQAENRSRKQSILWISLQLNNLRFSCCCHGRIEELRNCEAN